MTEHPPSSADLGQEQDVTEAVKRQYETFPYPPIPIEQVCRGFTPISSYTLGQYARIRRLCSPQGKRALVAGCGTGYELQVVLASNPGLAHVLGIDLSRTSIEIAQRRIQHHHLHTCTARVGNLLDPDTLPAGPFDLIVSYGVLHHTADPVLALQHLSQRLAPDGIIALMLYNRMGRMRVYNTREVLEKLNIHDLPTQDKLTFTRKLLSSFVPGSLFDTFSRVDRDYYQSDENVIDNFFHVNDVPFSVVEIPDFLAKADLEFLDVASHSNGWSLEQVVSRTHRQFYDLYAQLSPMDQLSVVELLDPFGRANNLVWGCHPGQKDWPQGFELGWFQSSQWQLNPLFQIYGEITCQDRRIPVSELCSQSPQDSTLPVNHLTLHWSLLDTPQRTAVLSSYQLQHLLLPLSTSPQSGEQICLTHAHLPQDHILNCFKRWEQARIVLRV